MNANPLKCRYEATRNKKMSSKLELDKDTDVRRDTDTDVESLTESDVTCEMTDSDTDLHLVSSNTNQLPAGTNQFHALGSGLWTLGSGRLGVGPISGLCIAICHWPTGHCMWGWELEGCGYSSGSRRGGDWG